MDINKTISKKAPATPERQECPVCMETFTVRNLRRAFQCGHRVCYTCDKQLFRRSIDTCPECRQPRRNMRRSGDELAQRQTHASQDTAAALDQVLFFPVERPSSAGAPEPRQPSTMSVAASLQALTSLAHNPLLGQAMGTVRNADEMPFAEFFRAVTRMRAHNDGGLTIQFIM